MVLEMTSGNNGIINKKQNKVKLSVLGQSLKSQALEPDYLDLNPNSATFGCVSINQDNCVAFSFISSSVKQG